MGAIPGSRVKRKSDWLLKWISDQRLVTFTAVEGISSSLLVLSHLSSGSEAISEKVRWFFVGPEWFMWSIKRLTCSGLRFGSSNSSPLSSQPRGYFRRWEVLFYFIWVELPPMEQVPMEAGRKNSVLICLLSMMEGIMLNILDANKYGIKIKICNICQNCQMHGQRGDYLRYYQWKSKRSQRCRAQTSHSRGSSSGVAQDLSTAVRNPFWPTLGLSHSTFINTFGRSPLQLHCGKVFN
ncbi:hypothetical protein BDR07DRAFT_1383653 [Suillus spraguei]|nr:hypothetical protein BDR07DRAFT_1383653 [Suillus spraguei]